VTADPDLFDRLGSLVNKIGEGEPLKGLRDEIDEIINRIKPK
ncbi:MAG: YhcN/YlaJ family sporulation lipoprotein, partial [Clostridiales bacterium]|nr:YhcN/YlaJ family sporulation lipoprotein [Clostridiales bacterium]